MPNGYTVIAQGATPDRGAQFGSRFGAGIGQGLGAQLGQHFQTGQIARQLNPIREALLSQLAQDPLTQPSPQQQVIMQALQDPRAFARLAGNEQGALELAQSFQQQVREPYQVEHVIDGDSEIGQEVGLKPGERGRVRFNYDGTGNLVGRPSLVTNPIGAEGEGGLMFGSGLQGRSYEYVVDFAPGFASNSLTPEQERTFLTAITNLRQPQTYRDPDTGLTVERRNELPDFARRALTQRGYQLTDQGIIAPQRVPQGPEAQAATQAAENSTIPADMQVVAPEEGMPTLYEIGLSGNLTGPIPAIRRFLTRIPGLGINFDEATSLKQYVTQMNRRVINSLRQNPRYAEGERQDLMASLELDPAIFDSPQSYGARVIGVDDALATIEQELTEVTTNRRELVSGETRQMAMDTLNNVRNFRQQLIPPRATNRQQVEQLIENSPPGTKFLYKSGDQWIMLEVTQ